MFYYQDTKLIFIKSISPPQAELSVFNQFKLNLNITLLGGLPSESLGLVTVWTFWKQFLKKDFCRVKLLQSRLPLFNSFSFFFFFTAEPSHLLATLVTMQKAFHKMSSSNTISSKNSEKSKLYFRKIYSLGNISMFFFKFYFFTF